MSLSAGEAVPLRARSRNMSGRSPEQERRRSGRVATPAPEAAGAAAAAVAIATTLEEAAAHCTQSGDFLPGTSQIACHTAAELWEKFGAASVAAGADAGAIARARASWMSSWGTKRRRVVAAAAESRLQTAGSLSELLQQGGGAFEYVHEVRPRSTTAAGEALAERLAASTGREASQYKPGHRKKRAAAGMGAAAVQITEALRSRPNKMKRANDALSRARTLERAQYQAACVAIASLWPPIWAEAKSKAGRGKVPRKDDLWEQLSQQVKAKYDGANWELAPPDSGSALSDELPKRNLARRSTEERLKARSAEAVAADPAAQISPPASVGPPTNIPSTLPDLLRATSNVRQLNGTGGTHKRDIKQQFEAAIKGSVFERHFDTASKFEQGYRTWLRTHSGDLSRAPATSKNKADIVRLRWMRFSVIILHQL